MLIKGESQGVVRYGGAYASTAALVANTAVQVVAPGANVNGCIVWNAMMHENGENKQALIAKTSAPANITDGDSLLGATRVNYQSSSPRTFSELLRPVFVPAGKGLYFISDAASSVGYRTCLYTLL